LPDLTVFNPRDVSRRRFLQGTAMAASALAVGPYISRLSAFAAPPLSPNQGILITIFLAGGNDGLNMVAPVGDPAYAGLRPTIGVTNGLSVGNGLALHPSLTKLKTHFDAGHVAVVSGVGYQPPDLSHFSSTDIWMHGWGGGTAPTTGWLGRYLDTLPNTSHESLYGVALHGGVNEHLGGSISNASSLPLNIGDAFGVDRSDPSDARMYDTLINMGLGSSGLGTLGDLYDSTEMDLLQLAQRINPAYNFTPPSTDISQQLVLAAHLINANLGIRVMDTELDGFDTHSDEPDWYATLMGRLDDAVDAFYLALDPQWRPQVTLMTFSEFGRRPEENGDQGTDHGSAAPLFVIGDNVQGGLHAAQPSLTNLDDDGNLIPAVDFRSVYSDVLGTWLQSDAAGVLGGSYSGLGLFKSGPGVTVVGPAPGGGGGSVSSMGYWLAGPKGGVHGVGSGIKFGSIAHVAKPIVAGAATPTHHGLWLTTAAGGIFCFGDAKPRGSLAGKHLKKPIVAMAATPSGNGYWLTNAAGGVYAFGDAKAHGNAANRHLEKPIVGMAATPSGKGYWLVTAGGGVFCFGDARPHGNTASKHLAKPVVDICATPSGKGYWLVTAGGGVYAFGDARVHGKAALHAPAVTIARTPTGRGYWIAAADGTVSAHGDAPKLEQVKAATATLVRCQ
jgi:uncharacterized protein (DUF1501 family)